MVKTHVWLMKQSKPALDKTGLQALSLIQNLKLLTVGRAQMAIAHRAA